jgi:guanylate kinase
MLSDKNIPQGKMIIITAPSGAGKTTIVRHLLKTFDFLDFSVSATTRVIRPNEKEGVDYFFKSIEEFNQLIDEGALAEWEEVYKNRYYGTLKSEIHRIWEAGNHIVFDIDVKGAVNLQLKYPDQSLSVFIKPPSLGVLLDRLKNRKTESKESLRRRIKKAKLELTYETLFDMVLVNDQLDIALKDAENIVQSFIFDEEE